MKNIYKYIFLPIQLLFSQNTILLAHHIVGADLELNLKESQNNNYEIVLNFYIDSNHQAEDDIYDNEVLSIYRKSDGFKMQEILLDKDKNLKLIYTNKKCADLFNLKTFLARYSKVIQLKSSNYSDSGGYYLVYDRCCRTKDIINIKDPTFSSLAIKLEFPSLKDYPNFTSVNFPIPNGDFACVGILFTGKYGPKLDKTNIANEIISPKNGYTTLPNFADLNSVYHPIYLDVNFNNGYSLLNPKVNITNEGYISLEAKEPGLITFSIKVFQNLGSNEIFSNTRDFLIPVVNCPTKKINFQPDINNDGNIIDSLIICNGNEEILYSNLDSLFFNFQWQFDGLNIENESFSNIISKKNGYYALSVSEKNNYVIGEMSKKVKVVNINSTNLPKIEKSNETLCTGETIVLKNTSNYEVLWYYNGGKLGISPSIEAKKSGTYKISTENYSSSCSNLNDSISLFFYESPKIDIEKDTIIYLCKKDTIKLSNSEFNGTYTWFKNYANINNLFSNTITITEPGEYFFVVKNDYDCVSKSSIYNVVERKSCNDIFVPDIFTPNGDLINDELMIHNLDKLIPFEINIYSQWGELIYKQINSYIPWNGKLNGENLPSGLYLFEYLTNDFKYSKPLYLIR